MTNWPEIQFGPINLWNAPKMVEYDQRLAEKAYAPKVRARERNQTQRKPHTERIQQIIDQRSCRNINNGASNE